MWLKSLPSLFLEPLTTCDFSIVRQEALMGLLATELLSPPCMAPELLWPGWRCHDTAAPGPHLPACPTVAAAANPRAEGDKLPEGAGPAPASTVVTLRSPSMVPRKWGDRRVPVPFRDLKAKLPLAMEIQNPKGETRPQHCRPCPPSHAVPQFPQKKQHFAWLPTLEQR